MNSICNVKSPDIPFSNLNRKLSFFASAAIGLGIGPALGTYIHELAHAVAMKIVFANSHPSIESGFKSGFCSYNFQGPATAQKNLCKAMQNSFTLIRQASSASDDSRVGISPTTSGSKVLSQELDLTSSWIGFLPFESALQAPFEVSYSIDSRVTIHACPDSLQVGTR